MKINFNNYSFVSIVLFLSILNPAEINSQQTNINVHDSILVAAKETINSNRYCVLITLNKEGIPHARTMDPFPIEEDFTIWFGTNKNSRKVEEIKNNPNVTVYYSSTDWQNYVSITGKAEIIDDKNEKDKRWKKEWEFFYPDNKKNYLLIKVTPIKMDVLTSKHSLTPDKNTWRIPHIKF